jgi:polyhydroxyalkanoate synthesis regulator phasin
MARGDADNLFARIREMSEEGLTAFFNDVMSNDRARQALGRAGERLMANKRVFDRNIETLLDFVNIPSKRDVRELKSRLDHLSSQLMNLSMKLDRLLAEGATPHPRTPAHADQHGARTTPHPRKRPKA